MSTDSIQKTVILSASRERVWRAISNADEFGYWFGVTFEGDFVEGQTIRGTLSGTKVDDEVFKMQKAYEGMAFEFLVEALEPESRFAFRWHPYAVDSAIDYSHEPMTLVEFSLAEVSEGTELTLTESGFDKIPIERRADALKANDGGWTIQMRLIEKYLSAN